MQELADACKMQGLNFVLPFYNGLVANRMQSRKDYPHQNNRMLTGIIIGKLS